MNNDTDAIVSEEEDAQKPELRGYKSVCAKLGLSMCVYFICRLTANFASPHLLESLDGINESLLGFLYYVFIIILSYIIPLAVTFAIFKYDAPLSTLYKKPRRVARALGVFPAAYGLGYGTALLTLLVSFLLSKVFGGETYVEQLLRPTTVGAPSNLTELIMLTVLMVVIAPLLEEYWVRGIMFDALRPYGAGIAIIISSLLFGLMHGSLYMLFYTTVFGLALGYIRYATGSLFICTILHAMVNSISATTLFLSSLVNMTNEQYRVLNTVEMLFAISVIVLIIAGVAVFFARIPTIKKYRFENPWSEVKPRKKIGIFFASVPVIIMMVLAFNEISGQLLLGLVIK